MTTPPQQHPIIAVGGLAEARRALDAAQGPVALYATPAAARAGGPAWWRELVAILAAERPGAVAAAVFDCGESAGLALMAHDAGLRDIAFGGPDAIARDLAGRGLRLHPPLSVAKAERRE